MGDICDNGLKTSLVITPERVKANTDVYLDMLSSELLPRIKQQDWEHSYCFMQDGAPSHTSKRTQAWCMENFENFCDNEMLPLSSPDLNPMDFSV